jgi:phosphoglycolate phosphatase
MGAVRPRRSALIIFDVDGTLFEAHRITVPAVQRSLAAFGLPAPEAKAITAWFGKPLEEYHAWLASLCPPDLASTVIARTDREELELIVSDGRLYPGVPEMLATLHAQGHVLATSSNAPQDYFDQVLERHGIRRYFAMPLCRGTEFADKRAMVAAIMARHAARPAIVIGDRRDDVDSAHANGALAIGAAYGFPLEGELESADAHVTRADELPSIIDALIATDRQRA